MKKGLLLITGLLVGMSVWGQVSLTNGANTSTQDFNSLTTAGTWTDNTTITGFYAKTDATASFASFALNTGSTTTPGLYSFGSAAASDRALGYIASNALFGTAGSQKGYLGLRIKNNGTTSISSIQVTWTGEEWRKENNAAAQTLSLSYQTGTTVTNLSSGSWISASSTFTSPIVGATAAAALDGNVAANRTANISTTISVTVAAGSEIMLRWEDLNDSGNDHALAIDDISINATFVAPNTAPTASSVSFSGTLTQGQTLTGSYTYSDTESDPEGSSTFKWYRSDNASGLNKAAISGATSLTYVLQGADVGKFISFEVTPVASAGTSPGTAVESAINASAVQAASNNAPVASAVSLTGTLHDGQTLTGSFTYSDSESDLEGTSTFKWYRANDGSGTGQAAISGATASTYVLTTADYNKYIAFEVTPVAQTGTTTGSPVKSSFSGPIGNDAPVASSVTFTGTLTEGQVLTGSYSYSDTEGNTQGTSTFKWYRSDDASGTNKAAISGATSSTYTLASGDVGKYISFEVTPVASAGNLTGTAVESSKQGAIAGLPILAKFDFPATSSLVVTSKNSNVTVSDVSLTAGTIESNITTGAYFPNEPYVEETGGWTAVTQAAAKAFTLTVTAQPGYQFSITNISFRGYATAAGPSAFGFSVNSEDLYSVNAPDAALVSVNQPVTGKTGLSSAVIKIQGWLNNSRTSNGTGVFRLDDVVIEGYVNPTPTTVQFGSATSSIAESGETIDLTVSIANPSGSVATTVDVALTGGTGSAADINSYTTQTVTFPAGSSTPQTVTLTVTDDALMEGNETLVFSLQNVTGGTSATLGAQTTHTLTITDNDNASITLSGSATESSENGAVITVNLTNDTFEPSLTTGNWAVTNLPAGVTKGMVTRVSDTQATIALSGNRTTDYDTNFSPVVTIDHAELVVTASGSVTANTGFTFTATDDAESITVASDGNITEGSEAGEILTVTLVGGTITLPIIQGSWTLNNLPAGLSKGTVTYVDATHVTIAITGTATDYDSDSLVTVTVIQDQIDDYGGPNLTSTNNVVFTAVVEAVGFEEQFIYTPHATNGLSTQSSNIWKKLNSGDSVLVTSGNLSYPGFKQSAGNKISFVGAGTDYYRPISSQSSGTVYFSFILNVTSLGSLNATGGYFGMLSDNATNFGSTIWLKANAPNYKIGIAPRTTTATFSSTDFAINTNVLIVASYQIVSGLANDIVKLWINPSSSTFGAGSEPTPDFNITNSGTDLASIARFLIRQDATAATPNIDMDELRVGSTWASVTPAGTAQNPTTGTYTDVDITGNTTLTGNLTVSGTLTISGANLNTGSNSINLGATGSLSGETTTNYIIGTVTANPTLNGSSPVGIAGLGLTINPNGNVMGSTVVTRRTGSTASVLGVGLNRQWTITPNSQPSSAVNVTITWPSSDDNGLNLGNLFIYKSEDNGATWQMHAGPLSTGTDPRSLSFTTTSFSDWTVGDGDSPLPIELLSWTATPGNKKVTLNWETASELNHDGFEIYRSTTTKENFRLFKSYISSNELKPKGNTGGKYSIVDQSVLNMETYHYKLVDVSVDGKRKEHKILTVIPTDGKPVQPGFVVPITFKISSIYPNPFNPTTNLVFDLPSDGLVVIRLYNVIGQEVQVIRNEIMKKGREKVVNITTNGLPSGVYMVSVEFGGQRLTKSLTFLK